MAIITADEARLGTNQKEDFFNRLISYALENGESKLNIYFEDIGYNYYDIQFIIDAGYDVYRNGPCLWWEVTW